jgi:hypothetical protein
MTVRGRTTTRDARRLATTEVFIDAAGSASVRRANGPIAERRRVAASETRRAAWTGLIKKLTTAVAGIACAPALAMATPSTTYWAPSVATCQAKYVPHVTYDTYYGKGTPPPGAGAPTYPIDTGLTMGVLPWDKVQAEVGYDVLLPSANPVAAFLNGKVCTPESSLFKGSPAIGAGIYNAGFHKDITGYNALYLAFQKSLPVGGYISAGLYHGMSDTLFTNSDGKVVKTGALLGWASPDVKIGVKGLEKLVFAADIQTGKNVLGGGGVGVYAFFNDYVSLLVGPVFYTDNKLQPGGSHHLWTTQLDVDIPLGKSKTP